MVQEFAKRSFLPYSGLVTLTWTITHLHIYNSSVHKYLGNVEKFPGRWIMISGRKSGAKIC